MLSIDGRKLPSFEQAAALEAARDLAEGGGEDGVVQLAVSGAPAYGTRAAGLTVALVSKWERAVRSLERSAAPTLAVASGDCGGTALDVLLASDIRIGTPDLRLLVSEDGGASWPGMAMFRLVRQAGLAATRRFLLFGTPIDAATALAAGLIDEVTTDPAGALAASTEMVRGLSGSELAIRRQLMFDASAMSFEDALGPHLAACDRSLRRMSGQMTG